MVLGLGLVGCVTTPPPVEEPVDTSTPVEPAIIQTPKYYPPYKVQPGEGLRAIATRYGLDYLQIANWNGIAPPYNLSAGQILLLSPPSSGPVDNSMGEPLIPHSASMLPKHNPSDDYDGPSNDPPLPSDYVANDWIWPTKGRVVQNFNRKKRTRHGIRIAGKFGQQIVAAESGRVIFSGEGLLGYGQLIIIKHAKNYLSAYGFNSKIMVRDGANVTRGEPIAEMGNSADGKPMLHFEIRRRGEVLNPIRLLPPR